MTAALIACLVVAGMTRPEAEALTVKMNQAFTRHDAYLRMPTVPHALARNANEEGQRLKERILLSGFEIAWSADGKGALK